MEVMWQTPVCSKKFVESFCGKLGSDRSQTGVGTREICWTRVRSCGGGRVVLSRRLFVLQRAVRGRRRCVAILLRLDMIEAGLAVKADLAIHSNGGFIRLRDRVAGLSTYVVAACVCPIAPLSVQIRG